MIRKESGMKVTKVTNGYKFPNTAFHKLIRLISQK
jgi:hypothetical protein